MADPITTAIATAVASGMAQSLTDQAKDAVTTLAGLIREKFRGRPAAHAALAAAEADPGSAARIDQFAHALDEAAATDPEFGTRIRDLWSVAQVSARDDSTVNIFHGRAEKVIQLHDVHGDISIN
jgi:hypothetical protein